MAAPEYAQTRNGLPVHIWEQSDKEIIGAWLGGDGWWRACTWGPDGQINQFASPHDLVLDREVNRV